MSGMGTAIPRVHAFMLGAIAASVLALPCAAFAQVAGQPSVAAASAPALVRWRHTMVKTSVPGKGCFTTSYPDKEWHEVPCMTTPPQSRSTPEYLPQAGAGVYAGGGNADYSAQVTSGTISQSEGSFIQVTDVTSEGDGGVANKFTLQLNSNKFTTAACNGIAGCQGWVQFIYANPYLPDGNTQARLLIEYWLLNYGSTCPKGWTSDSPAQPSCFYNSSLYYPLTLQTIGSLRSMTLTGTAGAGENDTVTFGLGGTLYSVSNNPANGPSDANIGLVENWTIAEFNIFGDSTLGSAAFNPGATLAVKVTVDNGTENTPSPVKEGTTGETNNLDVISGACPFAGTAGGASPGIAFLESNASPPPPVNCPALAHPYGWLAAVYQLLLQ